MIDLAAPWEFHCMFTRLLSRRIDGVSRRPVPAIPIPPFPVSPQSVFSMGVFFTKSEMSSILMVVRNEFTAQSPYVRFI